MRLPSYLTLGGTGSYACQRWETAKTTGEKIPFWVDDETTVDGFRVVPGWMHCTIYKDPSASALYSNGFYTVSKSTSGSHIWRNNYPLVLLHFSDKDKYEAYKKLWTDASNHQRQFFCYHDGTTFTVAQALNYCDKRQEIAILELERNWGSLAYQDDLLGVDRISVFFVSDNDYSRLLQVPYGYDHLKPISIGDKLGLVYWDGIFASNTGASISIKTDVTSPTGKPWYWVTARENGDKGLSLYDAYNQTKTILDHAGTINLSYLDAQVTQIEDTTEPLLKDHLFHVI